MICLVLLVSFLNTTRHGSTNVRPNRNCNMACCFQLLISNHTIHCGSAIGPPQNSRKIEPNQTKPLYIPKTNKINFFVGDEKERKRSKSNLVGERNTRNQDLYKAESGMYKDVAVIASVSLCVCVFLLSCLSNPALRALTSHARHKFHLGALDNDDFSCRTHWVNSFEYPSTKGNSMKRPGWFELLWNYQDGKKRSTRSVSLFGKAYK